MSQCQGIEKKSIACFQVIGKEFRTDPEFFENPAQVLFALVLFNWQRICLQKLVRKLPIHHYGIAAMFGDRVQIDDKLVCTPAAAIDVPESVRITDRAGTAGDIKGWPTYSEGALKITVQQRVEFVGEDQLSALVDEFIFNNSHLTVGLGIVISCNNLAAACCWQEVVEMKRQMVLQIVDVPFNIHSRSPTQNNGVGDNQECLSFVTDPF